MSNPSGIDVRIRVVYEGQAQADQAAASVRQVAAAAKEIPAAASSAAGAQNEFAQATEGLGDKQTSLHEILGSSRRETMFLEQSLLSITGTTGIAAHAFEALATGIGPIGVGVAVVAGGAELLKQRMDDVTKSLEEDRVKLVALHEEQAKAAGTGMNSWPSDENKKAVDAYDEAIKKVSGTLNNLQDIQKNMNSAVDTTAMSQQIVALDGQLKQLIDLRDRMLEKGYVAPDQINGLRETNQELSNMVTIIEKIPYDADAAFAKLAKIATLKPDSGADRMTGGLLDSTAGDVGTATTALYVKNEGNKTDIANRETQKRISAAESEAKAEAALWETINNASAVATPQIVANFQRIMASAGDAALHTKEFNAYLSTLPKDVQTKIHTSIDFGGNMDLAKSLGVGNAPAASRDWMKEFDAKFSEQKADVQQKFVQDAGGNKDKAQQNWQQQHSLELQGQMIADPKQFTNAQGAAGDMQKALNGELGKTKMSDPLMTAVGKDDKGLKGVGVAMAGTVGAAFSKELVSGMDDTTSQLVQRIFALGDGRWVKRPPVLSPDPG